ncbi:carbon-nitrogen hydrolase family protein [Desulfoluna sp.]|uniref:carbon-nitrogen hydrolase family protein n=1 Tax=Desulfoluna sp. TaxID=2045199 RepID=UPI00261F9C20|nr:carbon-nitrogen hydrolase family protein [Desulfoluna sp.]
MIKVGAVQMVARTADIAYNLAHIRELAEAVIAEGAKVIALPEFFTTSIVWDRRLWGCSLPPENPALEMLQALAQNHGVMIGGSYLEKRGEDVFNTYALVQPDGTVSKHDKDLPTMVEGAFYKKGADDGVHETSLGRVGTALCWETIRTQTVTRLKDRIDFLMTGSHWWAPPTRWYVMNGFFDSMARSNQEHMAAAPAELARILGVPNLHAAHAGDLDGRILLMPTDKITGIFPSYLLGETQIIDNKGAVLARMKREEGAGFVTAELDPTPASPTLETPERFWIPRLEKRFHLFWHHQNLCAGAMYRSARRQGLLRVND